jgi:hypothetical protein
VIATLLLVTQVTQVTLTRHIPECALRRIMSLSAGTAREIRAEDQRGSRGCRGCAPGVVARARRRVAPGSESREAMICRVGLVHCASRTRARGGERGCDARELTR